MTNQQTQIAQEWKSMKEIADALRQEGYKISKGRICSAIGEGIGRIDPDRRVHLDYIEGMSLREYSMRNILYGWCTKRKIECDEIATIDARYELNAMKRVSIAILERLRE